ncbi:AraC family transcriptional regulator ligand-binding domain-containing protein [Mycobacterium sp. NPDC006124]|uniref:AraC family transcriptional regulator n=1 Tax=Mycobacterium sp. NPDC006124 TaxID=3156729 RepID=UPI0033AE3594
MGSLIRATALWGYRELVHQLGGDANQFLSRFGIPRGADAEEGAFIGFDAYIHMLAASADELQCPDFGLRLSKWRGLDVLGPITVIARNARTVLDGADAIAHYLYVHSPALRLARAPWSTEAGVAFTLEATECRLPELAQGYEVGMAVAVRIIETLGGPGAVPAAVSFLHEQMGSDAAYREALGCPVRFGQTRCGLELSAELAATKIEGADAATRRIARKYLDSRYLPPTAPLSQRVADLAGNLLPTGQCNVDVIAGELAMHPRTLQRRLAEEGTSCQEVIDRERRANAGRYLAEPDLALGQVAGLLGYTEQSALNRSCRRWFAMTPRQYRMQLGSRRLREDLFLR